MARLGLVTSADGVVAIVTLSCRNLLASLASSTSPTAGG
jgi:hypothetical protein